MDLELTDKVVIVAGETTGIGAAITRAVAAEGAVTVIVDSDVEAGNLLHSQFPGSELIIRSWLRRRAATRPWIEPRRGSQGLKCWLTAPRGWATRLAGSMETPINTSSRWSGIFCITTTWRISRFPMWRSHAGTL